MFNLFSNATQATKACDRFKAIAKPASMAAVLALTACSTTPVAVPTPYKAAVTKEGYGYSSVQLSDNEYRVLFKATDETPADKVQEYALQRAGQIAMKQGYQYLAIVKTNVDKRPIEARRFITEPSSPATFTQDQQCTMSGCSQVAQPTAAEGQNSVQSTMINDIYYSIVVRMANAKEGLGKNVMAVGDIPPIEKK